MPTTDGPLGVAAYALAVAGLAELRADPEQLGRVLGRAELLLADDEARPGAVDALDLVPELYFRRASRHRCARPAREPATASQAHR